VGRALQLVLYKKSDGSKKRLNPISKTHQAVSNSDLITRDVLVLIATPNTVGITIAQTDEDQLVEESTGSKLVEPISCNEHSIGNIEACSFLYAGDDQEGKRYGILEIAFVDDNNLNHLISYRADPVNFDNEKSTMDHIIASYQVID